MNKKEYLLTQLASDCMGVALRVTKALHFGLDEVQPGQPFNNYARLMVEVYDMMGSLSLLQDEGILKVETDQLSEDAIEVKKIKILKYLDYADKHCGTLSPRLRQDRRKK